MKRLNKKGFTITELVIVIVVIAILAAVLIPTFVSLIKKANESVDMQIVKQMNSVLQAEEIAGNKPATVVAAKDILSENGCDDFTPSSKQNVFYWIGSDNRVILWEKDEGEDVTTGKVTYPKELAKKYKDVTTASADWADLSVDYNELLVEVVPEGEESLGDALLNSIKNAEDGAILKLPANSEVNIGDKAYYIGESYMRLAGGTGKSLTIDLNGGKLVSDTELIQNGKNFGYYGITVPQGGSLALVNGDVAVTTDNSSKAALSAGTGAHLILRDVNMTTNGSAIFPAGNASEVVIESCTIKAGAYALGTNNQQSDNIRISISNSGLEAESCPVLVNVPCDAHIQDSNIVSNGGWGVFVRSGHVVIENSTVVTRDGDVGANDSRYNTSCEYFAYNSNAANIPYWGEGAQCPYAPVIVGDYSSSDSYNHKTSLSMTNVKIENANSERIPDVVVAAGPSGKEVAVNYDAATNVSKVVVYGEGYVRTSINGSAINHTFSHKGTIKVNGNVKYFYAIPESVGTFETGEYDIGTLNVDYNTVPSYDYNSTVKSQIETAWGISISDTEWQTIKMTFSSATVNQLKSITYTKDDGTETTVSTSRITLTGLEHLSLLNTQNVSVLKQTGYVQNALNEFKAYCAANGITITDSTKIVIGDTDNVIVGVK